MNTTHSGGAATVKPEILEQGMRKLFESIKEEMKHYPQKKVRRTAREFWVVESSRYTAAVFEIYTEAVLYAEERSGSEIICVKECFTPLKKGRKSAKK